MQKKIILLVILISFIFLSACTASVVEMGAKKEVVEFTEKNYTLEDALELGIDTDSSNIEVYSWDKKQIKFEIKKRIRGTANKKQLEEKLKHFDIEMKHDGSKVIYKARYKKTIKNAADISIDLRVYLPKKINLINCRMDIGTLKFMDDLKADLNLDINMVNTEIKRLEGKINLKGDMGNLSIGNGYLESGSGISVDFGNIEINAAFQKIGEYNFETHTGNIDLVLPQDTKANFESFGTVPINEFQNADSQLKIRLSTDMGRITIKRIN